MGRVGLFKMRNRRRLPTLKEAEEFASIFRTLDGFCSINGIYRKDLETDRELMQRYNRWLASQGRPPFFIRQLCPTDSLLAALKQASDLLSSPQKRPTQPRTVVALANAERKHGR